MGRRLPVLAVAVISAIALQLLVPLVALVTPEKPNRLGWQMYSGLGQDDVVVLDGDGIEVEVPWQDVLAKTRRAELDWTQHLPEHLCQHVDEPTLTVNVGPRTRTVPC